MERFIDRENELQTLNREYTRAGSSFVVLYGRRRVGKTALVSEFIKDKPALFFLASEESESQNRIAFQQKVADFTGNVLLKNAAVSDWEILFRSIDPQSFPQKPVIVIDEFQYLGKSNPAFPSILQRIWDQYLSTQPVMLILCGSLISMMESQTLSYQSPLYGRRTAQLRLKQIPFAYYHEFFPGKSLHQLVELYSVTGGVPKYIELFSADADLYQSIAHSVLDRSSFLYEEPYFLLRQEVEEIGSYFSIIRAIAAGNTKLSAIAAVLGMKATGLSKYLKSLIDLDILEREVPVTEENPERSKKGLYKIKDHFLRFWFLFIYPNRSYIESGHPEIVLQEIRKSLTDRQTAFVYEDICREAMWQFSAQDLWPFHFSKVGRYWDKTQEIDVVALDPQGNNIVFGECKYWKNPVGINIFKQLEEKANQVPWRQEERKNWFILFSINGFTDELKALAKQRTDLLLRSGL